MLILVAVAREITEFGIGVIMQMLWLHSDAEELAAVFVFPVEVPVFPCFDVNELAEGEIIFSPVVIPLPLIASSGCPFAETINPFPSVVVAIETPETAVETL